MVDPVVVRRKLTKLDQYLGELEVLRGVTLEEYLADSRHRRAVERLIQLVVDAAVDLNTHVIVDAGLPAPADAYGSFVVAGKMGLLPDELAAEIAPSTGERNIIVHEYEAIDNVIVYRSIDLTLDLYRKYLAAATEYLKRYSGPTS